jgi:hypothetical protein
MPGVPGHFFATLAEALSFVADHEERPFAVIRRYRQVALKLRR